MAVFLIRGNINPFINKYLEVGTLTPIECFDGKQNAIKKPTIRYRM